MVKISIILLVHNGKKFLPYDLPSIFKLKTHEVVLNKFYKRKRKVLIFSPYNPYPPKGGGTLRVWKLAEELRKRGWSVTIMCYGNREKKICVNGILIEQLRFPLIYRFKTLLLNFFVKKFEMLNFLLNINYMRAKLEDKRIEKIIRELCPDVVQCESIWFSRSLINTTKKFGIPVVLTEHNIESEVMESFSLDVGCFKEVEKNIVMKFDYVVCVSEVDEETLREWGVERVKTIPSGFEPKYGKGINIRRKYGFPEDSFLGVFVGSAWLPNVEAVKHLCEIARELEEKVYFLVVGTVNKAFADKEVPKNVVFTDFVPEDELADIYRQCDFGVIPLTSGGGAKQKAIDLINAEVPFISTNKGVEGLTGYFNLKHLENCIIEEDLSKFSEWILKLRNNKRLYIKLKDGLRLGKKQKWGKMAKKYEQIYMLLYKGF